MMEISAIYLSASQLVDVHVVRSDGSVEEAQCWVEDLGVLASVLKLPVERQYPFLESVPLFARLGAQLSECRQSPVETPSPAAIETLPGSSLQSDQGKDVPSSLLQGLLASQTRSLQRCSSLARQILDLVRPRAE